MTKLSIIAFRGLVVGALSFFLAIDTGHKAACARLPLPNEQAEPEKTVPELIKALKDRSYSPDQYRAAEELGRRGLAAKSSASALADALKDPDPFVRMAAVRALGRVSLFPSAEVLSALKTAAKGKDTELRREATETLQSLLGKATKDNVLDLVKALKDPEPFVRSAAARALGRVSSFPASAEVSAALKATAKDRDPDVRGEATEALQSLLGKASKDQVHAVRNIELWGGKLILDEKRAGKPVVGVDLSNSRITNDHLSNLKALKHLHALNLNGAWNITDEGLKEIGELTNLQSLNLSPRVTEVGLKDLKELKSLQTLDLNGTDVSDVKELRELKSLRTLILANSAFTGKGLKDLNELKQLQELNLYMAPLVTEASLKQIKELKSLQTLELGWTPTTDAVVEGFKELKELRSLNLGNTPISDTGLKKLSQLKNLQSLDLSCTQVTDVGLKQLSGFKGLQSLDLGYTKVTSAGLKALRDFSSLQTLSLNDTLLMDAGLSELRELRRLQWLNLSNTQVTDAGLKELRGLEKLQMLSLVGTRVGDAGLRELKYLKSVQSLWLSSTQITDAGVKELKELKGLKELMLNGTRVGNEGLRELKHLENLQLLGLTKTNVTADGLHELKTFKNLKRLDLELHAFDKVTRAALHELMTARPDLEIVPRP
jgi:Leucine-rich repeat (LRR) protein